MSSNVSTRGIVIDGQVVESVIEPESVDDLRDVLAEAHASRSRVLIAGGRTRLAFGNDGGPYDVAISTRRLNRVIHYEPDDLTLAVEPGCTIEQIHNLLDEHRQMFALDAAHSDVATVGGSYATGLSGPRRLSGGSLKDWVIGVEVAGADGSIARAGGMVVKNVTGYDMMHLHFGALGAFGVVTRLNLKVFPRPGASRSIQLSYAGPVEAHKAGVALLRSQLQPSSLLVANDDGWRLHIRVDAPESAITRLVERLLNTAATAATPTDQIVLDDERAALLPFTEVVDLLNKPAVARLPVPTSRQAEVLASGNWATGMDVCADLGSGLLYVAGEPSADWLTAMTGIVSQPTYLKLPPELKRELDVFGPVSGPASDVIRRLKDAFDPNRQINPGRFVLGL